VTVQGAPTQPPSCDITGSNKRRKKKRRRRRRRGGAEDGCSEESSSDEKELEEPMSVTSQESSSQDIESDSKQSTNTTTVNNDSSSSPPLSSCQTLTPTDNDASVKSPSVEKHTTAFVSHTLEEGNSSAPSIEKDACKHNCNFKSVVREQETPHFISEQTLDASKDKNKDLNSIQLSNDHNHTEELAEKQIQSNFSLSSQVGEEANEPSLDKNIPSNLSNEILAADSTTKSLQEVLIESNNELSSLEVISQCNGDIKSTGNESNIKVEDSSKLGKQKKSGKQSNLKHKKSTKGKEEKQKRSTKSTSSVINLDSAQRKSSKKKYECVVGLNDFTQEITVVVNGICSENGTNEEAEICSNFTTVNEPEISNLEYKNNLVTSMDGNEKKPLGTEDLAVSSQDKCEATGSSISINSGNETKKYDSLAESEKSNKTPPKPVRKEKIKSPPSKPLEMGSAQVKVDASSIEFCPISLRPDVPKSKPKTQQGPSFSQQFRGTTDVLDSITEALIKEPALQSTSRDTSTIKEKDTITLVKGIQSDVSRVDVGIKDLAASKERISDLHSCATLDVTSSLEVIPVPPPRCKKLNSSSKQLFNVSEPVGSDALEESSGDSTTSSTTQESEESVIELLSSTHSSPEEKPNQDLSSDEEENIIFTQKITEVKSEILDNKSIPPDKTEVCTPSISGPSVKDSSQTFVEEKPSIPSSLDLMKTSLDDKHYSLNSIEHIELYAERLSKNIVFEAVRESSKKRLTLPITEAVTRWLRSQSPEILSVPPPDDGTDSDASSEEQEQSEKSVEANGNQQQSTGQKNVFCNPLPVPSLENCHYLLINNDVNFSGYSDGTGRRVALNQNTTAYKNDNNEMTISMPVTFGDESLGFGEKDKIYLTNNSENHVHSESNGHGQNIDCISNPDVIFNEVDCSSVRRSTIKDKKLGGNSPNICQKQNKNNFSEDLKKKNTKVHLKNSENIDKKTNLNMMDDDDLSFTSDETLECEWDLWDCNPTKPPQPLPSLAMMLSNNNNPTPVDEMLAKTPDDYCSRMCDPTVSVAKYYSLGTLQTTKKNCTKTDSDSSNYSGGGGGGGDDDDDDDDDDDEVVDALKHFQHELEDDDDGLQTFTARNVQVQEKRHYGNPEIYKSHYGEGGQRINFDDTCLGSKYATSLSQQTCSAHMFHRKTSVLVSTLKGDGPFPCGGICCILQ
ncbi:hypothetical protein L9F63_022969, partial [Diploptera punctata]